MRKIRDVLRLKLQARLYHEQTAGALDISKGVMAPQGGPPDEPLSPFGRTGRQFVLCAAGYNIRWLLRMIAKKGVPFLQTLFYTCCSTVVWLQWSDGRREK